MSLLCCSGARLGKFPSTISRSVNFTMRDARSVSVCARSRKAP